MVSTMAKGAVMTLDVVMLAKAVQFGLKVLAARLMALVGLIMTFTMFCWAMYLGSWTALATAGAFAVVVFLPVLASMRIKQGNQQETNDA